MDQLENCALCNIEDGLIISCRILAAEGYLLNCERQHIRYALVCRDSGEPVGNSDAQINHGVFRKLQSSAPQDKTRELLGDKGDRTLTDDKGYFQIFPIPSFDAHLG